MIPQTLQFDDKGTLQGLQPLALNHSGHPLHRQWMDTIALGHRAKSAGITETMATHVLEEKTGGLMQCNATTARIRVDLARRRAAPARTLDSVPAAGTFTRRADGKRTVREILEARGITDWDDKVAIQARLDNINAIAGNLSVAERTERAAADALDAARENVAAAKLGVATATASLDAARARLSERNEAMAADDVLRVTLAGFGPRARELFIKWLGEGAANEMIPDA